MSPADLESAPRPQHTRKLVGGSEVRTLAKRSRVRTLVVSGHVIGPLQSLIEALEQRLSIDGLHQEADRPGL